MKQHGWKVCSALLNKCLFPQVLPGMPVAATRRTAATAASSHTAQTSGRCARTMHITVDSADVTRLRQVVMQSCGQCVGLMRMSPLDHARRMQLCLSIPASAISTVMNAVMSALPQAEFGLRRLPQ